MLLSINFPLWHQVLEHLAIETLHISAVTPPSFYGKNVFFYSVTARMSVLASTGCEPALLRYIEYSIWHRNSQTADYRQHQKRECIPLGVTVNTIELSYEVRETRVSVIGMLAAGAALAFPVHWRLYAAAQSVPLRPQTFGYVPASSGICQSINTFSAFRETAAAL